MLNDHASHQTAGHGGEPLCPGRSEGRPAPGAGRVDWQAFSDRVGSRQHGSESTVPIALFLKGKKYFVYRLTPFNAHLYTTINLRYDIKSSGK